MDLKVTILFVCFATVFAYEDVTLVEYINSHSFIFLKNLIQQAGLENVLSQTGKYCILIFSNYYRYVIEMAH